MIMRFDCELLCFIKQKEKQMKVRFRHHQVQIDHSIERIIMCAEVYPPRSKKVCIADLDLLALAQRDSLLSKFRI